MSREAAPVSTMPPATPADQAADWRPGFWRRPAGQNLVPLATSLLCHALLVLAGIWGLAAYRNMAAPRPQQTIIPDAAILSGAPVGGIPNPGLGDDPHAAAQNIDPAATSEKWDDRAGRSLASSLMGPAKGDATDSVIGLGTRGAAGGAATPGLSGQAGAMTLAPFGVPGTGAQRPQSQFMGISGNAERIVYICDASGSMMGVFSRVQDELHKAVDVLRPSQAFNIIFFSDTDVIALNKQSLVVANPINKRRAFELSGKMSATGSTDPLPAIRMAFSQDPQLIYVLTDGFDLVVSFDAVINEFRKANANKHVKVNTILIQSRDDPELEKVLRTIADENGGVCRIVDRQSM